MSKSTEESDVYAWPHSRFNREVIEQAKKIKAILHPDGHDVLYPETEDELGNPKIAELIQLFGQELKDAVDAATTEAYSHYEEKFEAELANRVEKMMIEAQIEENKLYLVFSDIKHHSQQRIDELKRELVTLNNQPKDQQGVIKQVE